MRISTKGRYGLRAMIDMAINYTGEYTPLNVIAERQNISQQYLEHLFSILKKANLIKSTRGSQGGYILSRSPSKITVGEILKVLEGEINICCSECENTIEKIVDSKVWNCVNVSINNVINTITLDLIVDDYKAIEENNNYDYVI